MQPRKIRMSRVAATAPTGRDRRMAWTRDSLPGLCMFAPFHFRVCLLCFPRKPEGNELRARASRDEGASLHQLLSFEKANRRSGRPPDFGGDVEQPLSPSGERGEKIPTSGGA